MHVRRVERLQLLVEECVFFLLGINLAESADVSSGAFIWPVGAFGAVRQLV